LHDRYGAHPAGINGLAKQWAIRHPVVRWSDLVDPVDPPEIEAC